MYRSFVLFFLVLFCIHTTTQALPLKNTPIHHVIYITVDGIRWQDVFLDRTRLPKLWQKYAAKGIFYGEPDGQSVIEVASIPYSMPSYQSQLAGVVLPCSDNFCKRLSVETFPEKMIHYLQLEKKDVAVFSSWLGIKRASEHIAGTVFGNYGNTWMGDPKTHLPDPIMLYFNQKQTLDPAEFFDRYDQYTFAQALHYFEKYQPRFLWIALNDADVAAHQGDSIRYYQILSSYDDMFDALLSSLSNLGLDHETLVIFTTDHGRGNGKYWTEHGPSYPESKKTWAFVLNGQLKPLYKQEDISYYSTLSIRPTIENTLEIY